MTSHVAHATSFPRTEADASGLPPGPAWSPTVQTARWMTRPEEVLRRCHAAHGDVFTLRLLHQGSVVVIAEPELARIVFQADPERLRAGEGNAVVEPLVGRHSVLTLDGAEHLRERRLLLPPFHGDRVALYRRIVRRATEDDLLDWLRGRPLATLGHMRAVTLSVILQAVFGLSAGDRAEPLADALRRVLDMATSRAAMLARFAGSATPPAPVRAAIAEVDRLLYAEIARRRAAEDLSEREDVLSLLLQARHEDGSEMSEVQVRDELVTLLAAGHETTATVMAWMFERLVRHPEALERAVRAARDGQQDGSTYLTSVVQETLRLRPPLWLVARRTAAPFELGPWRIPAGVTLSPAVWLINRRAEVYPDPEAFRPDRFELKAPETYTWLPFGGGRRRCLGAAFASMELEEILATVLREVDLEVDESAGEPARRRAVVLAPGRGGRVTIGRGRVRRSPAPLESSA